MKKQIIILFSVFLLTTYAQANDPYGDGYDDAKTGAGDWSTNENYNDYMDGYEDAQIQMEAEERLKNERHGWDEKRRQEAENERQEREERIKKEQEHSNRNQNRINY
jgi:hypothetical protein